jgi:hypothetical protein
LTVHGRGKKMSGRTVCGIAVALLLIVCLASAFDTQPLEASGTIYIRADGSIDPQSAPISTSDNITYAFTGNINGSVVVQR